MDLKEFTNPNNKKFDLDNLILKAKLAKGVGHNYHGEPVRMAQLSFIYFSISYPTYYCI